MTHSNQLDLWISGFPKGEAEARIREIERELATLREAVALHDSFTSRNGIANDGTDTEPANRPDAIRRALRQGGNQPMSPAAIKRALIKRGWLKDAEAAQKRYYSTLYTMTKRGHVLRLHDGRYVLPPPRTEGDGMT